MAERFLSGASGGAGRAGERPSGEAAPRGRAPEVPVDERGVERALRAFKRLVTRDGILRDVRRRSRYEKPGERRRRKVREAARRLRRQRARAQRARERAAGV